MTLAAVWPAPGRIPRPAFLRKAPSVRPVKLYEKGQLNEGLYDILLRNSRFPEDLRGDIDAFVGANEVIRRRVTELCDRFGGNEVEAAFTKFSTAALRSCARKGLPFSLRGNSR